MYGTCYSVLLFNFWVLWIFAAHSAENRQSDMDAAAFHEEELEILYDGRVRPNQTPVFVSYHGWIMGLLIGKLSYQILAGVIAGNGAAPAQMGEGISILRPVKRLAHHIVAIKNIGIARVSFSEAYKTVLRPVIIFLGVAVALPYVITRGILPRVPGISVATLHTLFVFSWTFETQALLGVALWEKLELMLVQYHARVRDQQYLLHRELLNLSLEN